MKIFHSYCWCFQFVKVMKRNALHINGLTTRELLWVNLFTQHLVYLCITTCTFTVILIVSTHKHVMPFTCKMISSKDVYMYQMKNQFFNWWYVIFLTKMQNTAWFQYNNFMCCSFYFLTKFYIHEWRTFLPLSGDICLFK